MSGSDQIEFKKKKKAHSSHPESVFIIFSLSEVFCCTDEVLFGRFLKSGFASFRLPPPLTPELLLL